MGSLYSGPYSYHSAYNHTSFNIDTTITHLIFTIILTVGAMISLSPFYRWNLWDKEINVLVHDFNGLDGAHSRCGGGESVLLNLLIQMWTSPKPYWHSQNNVSPNVQISKLTGKISHITGPHSKVSPFIRNLLSAPPCAKHCLITEDISALLLFPLGRWVCLEQKE